MPTAGIATTVRNRVVASHDKFWKPEDFHGSPAAVAQALHRLIKDNELQRVRRGLYWRGTSTPLGMAPPRPGEIVRALIGTPGIGPAGPSAANLLGLSTQVPRWETLAVPHRPPRALERIHLVSRASSTARLGEKLTPAEVALLEVLRDWSLVETSEDAAARIIARHIADGTIRAGKVARAARTEPAPVRARLRTLLDKLGYSKDASAIKAPRSRLKATAA